MKEVNKMIELIQSKNDSPHYTIGYLTSMISRLAIKYPKVMKEVMETIDWIEAEA